ncbi:uncharacterized protein LOC129003107 [Macrosteles quadrilineatus]|uniref:uncharacterized protein LOC129003107 n=1 Tax=Macrosteles quadrilineatus TaxID=74068 RepID=UPI0023E21E19|nr:uncharacterized protein LOC129003107 [Macrosteles quadrilineatus]
MIAKFCRNGIDSLMKWCCDNEMTLNISKCSVISFSRSSTPIIFPYLLDGQPLPRSFRIKDLGVILSPNLNPQEHINCICKRAHSALYFIIRNSRNMFSINALRILYIHLVRPLLEFSSPVWSPYLIGQIESLENVQSRFIRLVGVLMGYDYRTVPIQNLQLQLNLRPLLARHEIFFLTFCS